ncbi:MAG TPA: glycosyltransferase [Solirubrobacteraceae bacterium]|jgi:glycosyltransferase involved in cell wall biosynthesis|nr:glycosyltransferase [Solirubrobacteraceae bacterium]
MSPPGPAGRSIEIVIVSLASTEGLRRADEELSTSLERAGAHVRIARASAPPPLRTLMLTDLAWARAARTAARECLARMQPSSPDAIIYSTTTAALMRPRAGAIRFDAPAAGNRPGRHGLWQRLVERHRLARAPLLLPWSDGGLCEAPPAARRGNRALILPVPVEPSGPLQQDREIAAITYAANPSKKGLDRVLEAWRGVRGERGSGELIVAGASEVELARAGFRVADEDGVRVVGALPADEYRALLRRARVFVCAPRREDYGISQLEALADGCLLVSTPAPGPYAALPLARALDPRLISTNLTGALHVALTDPLADYRDRALEALAPFRREAVDRLVADELLVRLCA